MKTISSNGLDFLKKEENSPLFQLEKANKDASSHLKPTIFFQAKTNKRIVVIGYGTTNLAFPEIENYVNNKGKLFTLINAHTYLLRFVKKLEVAFRHSNKFDTSLLISDCQYDAIISLAYSSGGESFFTRPKNQSFIALLVSALQGNKDDAKKLSILWPNFKVKDASGSVLNARRIRERDLFFQTSNITDPSSAPLGGSNNDPTNNKKNKPEKIDGYFEYVHYNGGLTKLDDIIKDQRWIDPDQEKSNNGVYISATKLLDLTSIKNRANVRDRYNQQQLIDVKSGQEESLIVVGTVLLIPFDCVGIDRINSVANTFFHAETNTARFIVDNISTLIDNSIYKDREISYKGLHANTQGGEDSLLKIYPRITVWMYCKSLGAYLPDAPLYATDGALINLTPFIQSINTTQGATGGSWSLSIQPISCECSENGWKLNRLSFAEFLHNKESSFVESVRAQHNNGAQFKRTNFLFHNIVTANDVIFIKFDDLNERSGRTSQKSFEFFVSPSQLPDQRYDMIGLVDSNSCSINHESASVNISITGKDLMKLLLEDGSYWINIPNFKPSLGLFKNGNFDPFTRTRSMRRFELIGAKNNPYSIFNFKKPQPLGELMATIFASLASTEICTDELFAYYQRAKISTYLKYDFEKKQVEKFNGAGIWSIIKVLQDEQILNRFIVDSSIDYHQGSLLLGMQKYCQAPWVELFGDTYGDQYYFIIRKPPFDYISFKALIDLSSKYGDTYTIGADRLISENLRYDDQQAYCWYRISSSKTIENVNIDAFNNNLFPAVYFPEYNEIFGNRAYDINSNYIDSIVGRVNNKDADTQHNPIHKQILSDLRYVIESTAYLPFTRKGTITISGHKRIKRGTVFKYEVTGEVFYVDQISLGYSIVGEKIEASTTYTVSRGMVHENDEGKDILRLYFNIINFAEASPSAHQSDQTTEEVKILKIYFDTDKDTIIDSTLGGTIRLPLEIATPSPTTKAGLKADDEQNLSQRKALREEAESEIIMLSQILLTDKSAKIEIAGHTDKDGGANYNLKLSQRRAESIKKLILNKLAALNKLVTPTEEIFTSYSDRITCIGYGATKPLSYVQDQNAKSIKQINRRTEAKITRTIKKQVQSTNETNKSLNWHVNQDIFNFLLKKKQFCSTVNSVIFDKINNPSPPRFSKLDQLKEGVDLLPLNNDSGLA